MNMEQKGSSKKGIVVKLWDIKSSKGANGKADIAASINYIDDEEKTSVEAKIDDSNINNAVAYALNDLKTMHRALVGSYLIGDIDKAAQEMTDIKDMFGKAKGRSAIHGIISLDSSDSDIKNTGKLISMTRDVLTELFPNHQFVYAVHTNTDNLHVHFIVNSVGMDGHKIHRANDYFQTKLQPTVNDMALKYGFTPNARWLEKRPPDKITYVERKILLRKDIDKAIERSLDFDEFCKHLRNKGYVVNVGKHISLRNKDMQKAIRTGQLGDRYTIPAITERIANRLEDFNYAVAANHVKTVQFEKDTYVVSKMPKYQDMTKTQQQEVIKLLKQGRNPWQEYYLRSWQYQKINREIMLEANAHKVIKEYSAAGNITTAMNEIIDRQKQISIDKKAINKNLKNYKPVRDLFSQIQKLQVRAFLYEYHGSEEYEDEYEQYMALVKRLKDGYNKTPEDVYEFLMDQQNQLIYLEAQRKELNNEYQAIRKYIVDDISRARQMGVSLNLAELSNFYSDIKNGDRTGQIVADTTYVVSKEGQYVVRMTKSAYINEKGKPKQDVEFVVMDRYGTILKGISMKQSENFKAFCTQVNNLQKEYGLTDCFERRNFADAVSLLQTDQVEKKKYA